MKKDFIHVKSDQVMITAPATVHSCATVHNFLKRQRDLVM